MSEPESVGPVDPGPRPGVVAYFARNHVAARVLFALLLIGGIAVLQLITLETFPRYDPREIRIEVPYPGAVPREVEEDITKRIEESLVGTIGVSRIVSRSQEGRAVVVAELEPFADDVDTLNFVRTAIERIEDFPPANADQPEVTKAEVTRHVLTVAVRSNTLDHYGLRRAAEAVRENLLLLPSVSIVEPFGTSDQEIQIEVTEEALRKYGLTFRDLVQIVRRESVNVTGGELRTGSGDIILSTLAKREYADEFSDIVVVAQPDGTLVRLGEIARLRDSLVEQATYATTNGVRTVFLQVNVTADTSPMDASEQIRELLSGYEVSGDVDVVVWEDASWTVEDRLYVIARNGAVGLALVLLMLLLLFDLRIAIWVTVGVPLVFVASLIFFPVFGLSINVITLFAFFMLIGIVVDDSIIVGESVATQRENGLAGVDAAVAGTREVLSPIAVGALTTMAAFAALLPLDGMIGQMFRSLPVLVFVVLLLSLLESCVVMPGHLAKEGNWSRWPLVGLQERLRASFQRVVDSTILPMVSWSVRRAAWPPVIVTVGVLVAGGLIATGVLKFDASLGVVNERDVQVDLVLPRAARVADVEAAAARVLEVAGQFNEGNGGTTLNAAAVVIGQHIPLESYPGSAAPEHAGNVASVRFRLNPMPVRTVAGEDFSRALQARLADFPGLESVSFPTKRILTSEQLSIELIHPETEVVTAAATEIAAALRQHEGVGNVTESMATGKRRVAVRLNAAGQAAGLTAASVALQLRAAFYGAEAQRVQRGREEVLVMVRYPEERRVRYADLLNERIFLPNGRRQVPLSTVATLTESYGMAKRLRIDGRAAAIVTADIRGTAAFPDDVFNALESRILPQLQARHPELQISKQGESQAIDRVAGTLSWTIPLAVFVIYCFIASFLRSFVQPLLVLAGVPMAFVGAVLGHLLLGYDFSVASIFGLIAVAGIVVNDAILIMHRYNRIRRESDIPGVAALSGATLARARAVLLTSATTVVGLTPMLFTHSESISFLVPLVVSVVFGLIAGGVGLLLFLPSVILLTEVTKTRLSRGPHA